MKKKIIVFTILILTTFFNIKETYAYSSTDYANRTLCGTFEVAEFFADGKVEAKSCHANFDEAKAAMIKDGNDNLAILGKMAGVAKIYDANAALVDFTKTNELIYLYKTSQITEAHSYMNGQSTYGAVDGALIDSGYSHSLNVFVNRVKIGGFDGWVRTSAIEIVPLVWVKSSSSYTVSNESIRHNYVAKIQNTYSGSSGNTIGPKPSMLNTGTYYSYDGHYFYKDLLTMLKDYNIGTYANSVNKEQPYYNYYQFLPQHTRTTYSSINIDEYIRNVMGYKRDVYGTTALSNQNIATSRLYGQGTFFYNAQELYGANALLAFGVSRNESGNGKSSLAINKNNGFGLNAVDSNPTEAANWFATYSQSILDYSNVWVTYGYSEPTDWRYFGAQNGNKFIGMNVKYASDVYWGEKMASNYYNLDKALGLQDYNFYQTAVTTKATAAKKEPNLSSKTVYNYVSADNGLVILGEVEGEAVNGNKKWYKVVSDMNIDSNFNQITSGYYNWDSYVYIPAAYVLKTNEGKNGYISPNDVTEYQDKFYTYDLYIEGGALKPKVAISVKDTKYYYDPSLQSQKDQTLLKNRYVMVYATAYDKDKSPVSYLVTSDYKYSQKHWVSANSIKFVTARYGQASVTVPNTNTYSLVNPTTVDSVENHISGLYHYAYTPILEETTINGQVWYKVPVDLSGTTKEFGWTLKSDTNVLINTYQYNAENTAPVINAENKEITQGQKFDEKINVSATDAEDGNITDKIEITENTVKNDTPGIYKVTYKVTDTYGITITKTITITVLADEEPIINASNKTIALNNEFNELLDITASDKEDGDITKNIKVIKNTINTQEKGKYEIIYQVSDSFGHIVEKKIFITVQEIELIKKNGRFDLDYLKVANKKLAIKGYSTIDGIDNTNKITIEYKIIFKNLYDSTKTYEQSLRRILNDKELTYQTPSNDGKNYKYSWFEGEIDITTIPNGDYVMYIQASTDKYYSQTIVNNQMFSEQLIDMELDNKYVMTRNNYFTTNKQIELIVRNKKIGEKTVSALSNQYGQLEDISFTKDNKLYIYGNAFTTNSNLGLKANVSRKIIFENMDTFEKIEYSIGAINGGDYVVKLPVDDKLGKEKAWYKKEIDISNIPKGNYTIYIETSSNISDFGELNEQLFRDLSNVKATINDKNYAFNVNYNQRYRVELIVN